MEKVEISAEVHFAQKLAANEKKIRDRAIKRLQKYLYVRSNHKVGLSDADFLKVWKGLFYCMWMQDKPLIQEELSKRITSLLLCFQQTQDALRFMKVFLETLAREWNGIDRLRLDKFMMMLRDMLQETFKLLGKAAWQLTDCQSLSTSISQHVMQPSDSRLPDGLKLHLADIFLEEMQKVSLTKMTSKKMVILLKPFIDFVLHSNKLELVKRIMSDVICKSINSMSVGDVKDVAGAADTEMEVSEDQEESGLDGSDQKTSEQEQQQTFTLNLSLMLALMFKLAGRKDVCAPNRAIVYKLVKSHPDIYQEIINATNSAIVTSCGENAGGNDEMDLHFLKDDGKAVDRPQNEKSKKKKKQKKKKRAEQLTSVQEHNAETVCEGNSGIDDDDVLGKNRKAEHNKKSKKRKLASTEELVSDKLQDGSSDVPVTQNRNSTSGAETPPAIQKKKRKFTAEDGEVLQPAHKKRKFNSSHENCLDEDSDNCHLSEKSEGSEVNNNCEVTVSNMVDWKRGENNMNSNARTKCRSASPCKRTPLDPNKAAELSSSFVSFHASLSPRKCQKKDKLFVSSNGEAVHDSEGASLASVLTAQGVANTPSLSDSTEQKKKKRRNSTGSQVPLDSAAKIVGELCTVLTTPCTMVKKALALVTPESSTTGDKKTPSGVVTSGSKKKVIFDLRRNKANKFQDYLKSLQQQPDPPYEPTKSPSAGILKSPAISPPLSPTASECSDSNLDDSQSSHKKKKKQFWRTSASASNRGRKHNHSPRRCSLSPSPSGRKYKSKNKGKVKK